MATAEHTSFTVRTTELAKIQLAKIELAKMREVDPATRIRGLCRQLSQERDSGRIKELASALRDAIEVEQDEARLRMRYIAKYYRGRIRDSAPTEYTEPVAGSAQRIRAVLGFLGFGPGTRMCSKAEN
jgi:acetolactate synthase small subunit